MKTIKKLIVLTLVCSLPFMLQSCGDDVRLPDDPITDPEGPAGDDKDDPSGDDQGGKNKIIGRWHKIGSTKSTYNDLSDCEKKTTIVFTENGDYINYANGIKNDICQEYVNRGRWEMSDKEVYTLHVSSERIAFTITVKDDVLKILFTEEDGEKVEASFKRDTTVDETEKQVIGRWGLVKHSEGGGDNLSDCEKKSTIAFTQDKKFVIMNYEEVANKECSLLNTIKGTYEILDKTLIRYTYKKKGTDVGVLLKLTIANDRLQYNSIDDKGDVKATTYYLYQKLKK